MTSAATLSFQAAPSDYSHSRQHWTVQRVDSADTGDGREGVHVDNGKGAEPSLGNYDGVKER